MKKITKNMIKQQINQKTIWLVIKFIWSILVVALFLIWLIFATNNFYPKNSNSLIGKLNAVSIKIMIWPITFISLFLFFLPIWMTNSYRILMIVFSLNSFLIFLQFWILFNLNHNQFWYFWLATLLACSVMIIIIITFCNWNLRHTMLIKKKCSA